MSNPKCTNIQPRVLCPRKGGVNGANARCRMKRVPRGEKSVSTIEAVESPRCSTLHDLVTAEAPLILSSTECKDNIVLVECFYRHGTFGSLHQGSRHEAA